MKKLFLACFLVFMMVPGTVGAQTRDIVTSSFSLLTTDDRIIEEIAKEEVTNSSYVSCSSEVYIPYQIVSVIRTIQVFIKIGIPILFIIMGMLDFGKVVLGKPDEEMKKVKKTFGSRLIAAVLVFLVVTIVEMVLPIINAGGDVLNCTKCIMLDDEHCQYMNISYPSTPQNTPVAPPIPTKKPTPSPTGTPVPTETPVPSEEPIPEESPSPSPIS